MGSNVDALIAAGIHPPQVEDPSAVAMRAMQMRDMQQRGAYQGQLAQLAGLQMQKEQRALDDDQITRQAYMDAGGDLNQTQQLIRQRGGSPEAVQGIDNQRFALRQKAAQTDEAELKATAERHNALRGAAIAYLGQPDDAKQQQWGDFLKQQLQSGTMTQQEYAHTLNAHPTYPGDQQLQLYANGLRTGTQAAEEELKKRQDDRAQRQDTRQQTEFEQNQDDRQRQQAAVNLSQSKDQADYAARLGELPKKIADKFPAQFDRDEVLNAGRTAQQIVAGENKAEPRNRTEGDWIAVKNDPNSTAEQKAQADQALKDFARQKAADRPVVQVLTPGSDASNTTAQAIAQGDLNPATARSLLRRNPALISEVKKVDPNFDEANIEKRYATNREFSNAQAGHLGGQRNALNTLIQHADLYMDVADALKNGTFRPGNAIYNKFADMFGSAPPTEANLVARFLASETGKVATGGVPAEGEINGLLESLKNDSSPQQFKKVGQRMLEIAGGRLQTLSDVRDDANLQKVVKIVLPRAQAVLQKRGIDPETLKPTQGGGGGGMIQVQIPGHPPGQIRADQKDAFLKKYPNAKVF